jgi:GntR family transcriptional regulator
MPLYHQIYLQLRDEIVSGERGFGTSMPTEQDLARLFSVSRITARRVLDDLAQQDFVARKRRVGTTVTFRSPVKSIEANIDDALDSLLKLGHGTQVRVLDVAIERAPIAVTEALALAPETEVLCAVRTRSLDGIPLGYVLSYMPAHFAGIVTRAALETSPMLELLALAGHRAAAAEQTIGAMLADTVIAKALHIEPRSALLRIRRSVQDKSGTPILLTVAHYRSDRFHIRLDLLNSRGESARLHQATTPALNNASTVTSSIPASSNIALEAAPAAPSR